VEAINRQNTPFFGIYKKQSRVISPVCHREHTTAIAVEQFVGAKATAH
jgi:hypothetical protein